MIWLYLVMAIMLIVAIALVFVPLWTDSTLSQQQLNLQLYQDRKRELVLEQRQGLVDQDRFDELDSELKRSLLDDAEQQEKSQQSVNWIVLLPGVIVLLLCSLGMYAHFGNSQQLSHWQQVMKQLPDLAQKALKPAAGHELNRQQMQDLALGIRTRLSEQDDTNAWVFLGRVGFALGEKELAVGAYQKALDRAPDDKAALLGLAQVKLLSGDKADLADADTSLKKLLALEPGNTDALLLQGFVAYQRQDYKQAMAVWQDLADNLPANDPRAAMVAARIADAKSKLKGAGRKLLVKISVSPELKASLPDSAVLFVYAKAAAGGPPLAAVRLPLTRLPTEVELSGSTSMIPGRSLADASSYIVGARVSQSGQIGKVQSGDLSGEKGPVSAAEQQISLVIDKRTK
ncbi:c-type cytochrome biogenesis protein CcmI [Gallaecimonas mangrovi]|uniref:c-type cytochrome biogenesis protein CcmI n=1 Tax=Gallaecimonas mangrovi TaxID=2291597 RepID=UPI000E206F36|nr:c-type cytochrome biogenesis protein CcmI [Gallaecimonas mangrovi]